CAQLGLSRIAGNAPSPPYLLQRFFFRNYSFLVTIFFCYLLCDPRGWSFFPRAALRENARNPRSPVTARRFFLREINPRSLSTRQNRGHIPASLKRSTRLALRSPCLLPPWPGVGYDRSI